MGAGTTIQHHRTRSLTWGQFEQNINISRELIIKKDKKCANGTMSLPRNLDQPVLKDTSSNNWICHLQNKFKEALPQFFFRSVTDQTRF